MNPIKFCWHVIRDAIGFTAILFGTWFLLVVANAFMGGVL